MIAVNFMLALVIFLALFGAITSGEKKKTFIVNGIREIE